MENRRGKQSVLHTYPFFLLPLICPDYSSTVPFYLDNSSSHSFRLCHRVTKSLIFPSTYNVYTFFSSFPKDNFFLDTVQADNDFRHSRKPGITSLWFQWFRPDIVGTNFVQGVGRAFLALLSRHFFLSIAYRL